MARGALPLVCGAVVLALAATRADSISKAQRISRGCPGRVTGYDVRAMSVDSVVAVARRVVIDHVVVR